MEPKLPNVGSSSNTAMQSKHPKEEIFQRYVYAYLIEKGYKRTAQDFQTETQLTQPMPDPADEPRDYLSHFWGILFEVHNSIVRQHIEQTSPQNQHPSDTSMQNQVIVQQPLNIGPVINTTAAQLIPLQLHSSFESGTGTILLSCDISSDGKIVATGGKGKGSLGKNPLICYTETGNSVTAHDRHIRTIREVRFHPSYNMFATASADRSVKLWNATALLSIKKRDALKHQGTVRSLDFYPLDIKTLCSSDNAEIKVWDLNKYMKAYGSKEGGSIVRVQPVDGRLLAVAKGKCITIFEYPDLVVVKKLEGHVKVIKSICWDITGKMIASVSEDEVRVWSVNQLGECIHNCPYNGKKFKSVIFHPRYDKALVIGGHECLLLLNLEDMREYPTDVSEISINGIAATRAQSQFIASASDDCLVKIWK